MSAKNPLPEHLRCRLKRIPIISTREDVIKIAAPKSAQFLYNALRVGPRVILRSAFELLRANTFTRILSCAVLLSVDTVGLFRRRISAKQYLVNIILAALLLVGGAIGWDIGGRALGPHIENAAIGMVAALFGAGFLGMAFSYAGERLIALFYKSDTEKMLELFNYEFYCEVSGRKMGEAEIARARDIIELTPRHTADMFACRDKAGFARALICPAVARAQEKAESQTKEAP